MDKSRLAVLAVWLMAAAVIPPLSSEKLIFTTSYPSPAGVYQHLLTTGGSPANPGNTILARDAGNVGVGTSLPAAKLHVLGSAPGFVGASITNGNANGRAILWFNNAGDATTPGYLQWVGPGYAHIDGVNLSYPNTFELGSAQNNVNLALVTRGYSRIRVQNTGEVGVGTINPRSLLHIHAGDVYISSDLPTQPRGVILKSPNGLVCRRLWIDDSGNFHVDGLACP